MNRYNEPMIATFFASGRRVLVPEVVQSSAMDCGPAALKSLLEGFGVSASYGRLREACQTDVDGTSIDTLEEVAIQLGLDAEQVIVPADHLLVAEAHNLPALVVVRLPNGMTHFVVAWNVAGPFVQVMDPSTGRRWVSRQHFLNELYIHTHPVPAEDWREWAATDEFVVPLRMRLAYVSRHAEDSNLFHLIDIALEDPGWYTLASLDASTRMVESLIQAGGLRLGQEAALVLGQIFEQARYESPRTGTTVPASYWSVQPADDDDTLLLKGPVLVRILGYRTGPILSDGDEAEGMPLSPDLVAALEEPPARPALDIVRLLREDGLLTPVTLLLALLLSSGSVIIQALLMLSMLDLGKTLNIAGQRLGAVAALVFFLASVLFLEMPIHTIGMRLGRHMETRLRLSFLRKIPRLGDRYFQSRLISDMAQRVHTLRYLRILPGLGLDFLRLAFQLVFTTCGIIWLDPTSAPLALLAAFATAGIALSAQPVLIERDLRLRTHLGALSHFYLDALLGLIPIRTHRAEQAVRREHESLLVEWARSSYDFFRVEVATGSIGVLVGSVFAVLLLFHYIAGGGETSSALLLFFWALNIPVLGKGLIALAQQYPHHRNRVLRLFEPLNAPEDGEWCDEDGQGDEATVRRRDEATRDDEATARRCDDASDDDVWRDDAMARGCNDSSQPHSEDVEREGNSSPRRLVASSQLDGMAIEMQKVSVRAGGHTILSDITLTIEPGEHVAIIGPSGAGKSSLVGILLGWYRPAAGRVAIDGVDLAGQALPRLRQHIAWIDPSVQIWNRSMLENLRYGVTATDTTTADLPIEEANLFGVLEKLPDGLQTFLGEGGGLVSGGEGQRVRLGRAFYRPGIRLAILDEPFRGLDRDQRRVLLTRARQHWSHASLLFISHDVGETLSFDRVIVIEHGHIVEDERPDVLVDRADSRYRALLQAEEAVRTGLWSSDVWRRVWLENGQTREHES